jgi:hypothetical protein
LNIFFVYDPEISRRKRILNYSLKIIGYFLFSMV